MQSSKKKANLLEIKSLSTSSYAFLLLHDVVKKTNSKYASSNFFNSNLKFHTVFLTINLSSFAYEDTFSHNIVKLYIFLN